MSRREARPPARGGAVNIGAVLTFLFVAAVCRANTCTPITAAANGNWPAIKNGLRNLNAYGVQILWTTDNNPTAATMQRILYCTNGAGCTSGTIGSGGLMAYYGQPSTSTSTADPQGYSLTNLIPGQTYWALPQSQMGTTGGPKGDGWCNSTEVSFATPAAPAAWWPTPPVVDSTVNNATVLPPNTTGKVWRDGTNCKGAQDCIASAGPGDYIQLTAGTTYTVNSSASLVFPANPNAIQIMSYTLNNGSPASTFTYSTTKVGGGTVRVTANEAIRFSASPYYVPNPLNPGFTYYVVKLNPGNQTFQVSQTPGGPPVSLVANGVGKLYFAKWPLAQNWIVLNSSAPASLLPPFGVRTDPTYLPNVPNLQKTNPLSGTAQAPTLIFGPFASYYWLANFALSTRASGDTSTDPPWYDNLIIADQSNDHIVLDRMILAPAKSPDRIRLAGQMNAGNAAIINSYMTGLDYTKPSRTFLAANVSGNIITFAAGNMAYPTSTGAKVCTTQTMSLTPTGGSGYGVLYIDPTSCVVHADLATGVTATASGLSIANVATPVYPHASTTGFYTALNIGFFQVAAGIITPVYCPSDFASVLFCDETVLTYSMSHQGVYGPISYISGGTASGSGTCNATVVPSPYGYNASGTVSVGSGVISNFTLKANGNGMSQVPTQWTLASGTASCSGTITTSGGYLAGGNNSEGALGIETINTPGGYIFKNNFCQGSGVACLYFPDDLGSNGCAGTGGCQALYNSSNILIQRNWFQYSPLCVVNGPGWGGGNCAPRNGPELKTGAEVEWDGNVFWNWTQGIGAGEAMGLESFASSTLAGQISWNDSSNQTVTNNTLHDSTGLFIQMGKYEAPATSQMVQKVLIDNNLVYNLNGWNMPPQWLGQNQFNKGNLIQFAPGTSFLQVSHLTAINIRGATPWLGFFVNALIGGFSYINNAVEYSNDNGDGGFYYSEACGQGYYPTPSCNTPSLNGATNGTLLAALHGLKFGNNVIIPAWLTSDPGAPKEYGSTEITNLKDSFRGYVNYFPADDTHGERVKAVKFHDSKGNFRLSPKSPYISGAHLSSDGMPIGVDMDKLEVAQGHVSNVRVVGVPSTSTTLAFLAPDTFGCQVDWSTNSFNTFTRVANAGGQRNQSVVLTLPAHTTLTARVDCAVEQAKITIVVP